jgi:hypothetical protein
MKRMVSFGGDDQLIDYISSQVMATTKKIEAFCSVYRAFHP